MHINLRDIPEIGESISWTEKDPDLNKALHEIVKKNPVAIRIDLLPLEDGADIRGEITTTLTQPCSFCAYDIPIKVHEKFHEIVMIGKKDKFISEGENHLYPDSVNTEFQVTDTPNFDLGNLLREVLISNTPIQPKCVEKGGAPDVSPKCMADWDYQKFTSNDEPVKAKPFNILKDIKLKK